LEETRSKVYSFRRHSLVENLEDKSVRTQLVTGAF